MESTFTLEKETKNTYRFQEDESSGPQKKPKENNTETGVPLSQEGRREGDPPEPNPPRAV